MHFTKEKVTQRHTVKNQGHAAFQMKKTGEGFLLIRVQLCDPKENQVIRRQQCSRSGVGVWVGRNRTRGTGNRPTRWRKAVFSINTAEPLGHPSGKALNPDTLLHTIHKNPLQEHCRPTQEGHKLQKKTLGNSFVDQGQPRLS